MDKGLKSMGINLVDNLLYEEDLKQMADSDIPWEKLKGKRILIAGATGMIGKCLIDLIMYKNDKSDLNCRLTVFSRNGKTARKRFNPGYFEAPFFEYRCHDICEPWEASIGEEYDYIINMASNTHPVAYLEKPIDTIWANVMGTRNMLDLCTLNPATRFVLTSSVEIYGENRNDVEFFDEKYLGYIDSNTLRAGYPESKRLCEALCQAYIKEKGIEAAIVRLPRVFGPTMSEKDSKAVAQFIKKAVKGEKIVLKSEGLQHYSFLYVADAVMGVLTVMLKGTSGEAYNVADSSCDGLLKNAAEICADEGGTNVVFELPDEVEKAGYSTATKALLDGTKIKELGWNPNYTFEKGLRRTIKALKI